MRRTIKERLIARRCITDTGCWLWTGRLTKAGYGQISVKNRQQQVHRVAYEAWVGAIPDGLTIDHLCRIRNCFNFAHLEPVSQKTNTLRGQTITARNLAKTHCPQGHEYATENTYRTTGGGRRCRQCQREHHTKWKQRKSSVALSSHRGH